MRLACRVPLPICLHHYNICSRQPSSYQMTALTIGAMSSDQNREISEAVEEQRTRLRNFIRARVPDPADVEDILQDVFFELVEAYRLMKPIQTLSGWVFQVARNRIIDRFRKKKIEAAREFTSITEDGDRLAI